ncbi:MAG: alanine--tRNA ligase [Planctomycetes bacterium]|nr:alanine--tRNA ligase [Planctomycetota bacterium]
MKAQEIRRRYLEFFEARGHTVYPSASLVPENDPTLLFTGAGMNQFKDMFLGKGRLPFKRAVTCQKCLRTGDIEEVGASPFHHSFFEMLGNFSFGNYFKADAIKWAWEFLVDDMKLEPEKIWVTVYKDDDESYDIWKKDVGVPENKILRLEADENFWPADAPAKGPNGPCGPCSEIYVDTTGKGCGNEPCDPTCDCKRFVEIWNLVFTQFDRKDGGVLDPLPTKNIDTGMGLERMAAVMQGVRSSAETDLFVPIIREAARLLSITYDKTTPDGAKVRRIADHTRAIVFCIADGVLPSNKGRGNVERRLLRRAVRDGIDLGLDEPFICRLVPIITKTMSDAYPEIVDRRENIGRIIRIEEERFHHTLEQGAKLLDEMIGELKEKSADTLSGKNGFLLYDTYGFPADMTESELAEHGLKLDQAGFEQEMARQRRMARSSTTMGEVFDTGPLNEIKGAIEPTEFAGYTETGLDANVQAIISGEIVADSAAEGEDVSVVLDRTPFYGASGGQVGDHGTLTWENGEMVVCDTQRADGFVLHMGEVRRGTLKKGQAVNVAIDSDRRLAIRRNHTATHLLHYALRLVLGKHVEQAGSLVAPGRFRFDFTHFSPCKKDELKQVEQIVNEMIVRNIPVTPYETSLEEAREAGVIALFTEKYGERVRVVQIGDVSSELCGGTHVDHTGEIGLIKIVGEESIAAGVRRIEAVTGSAALEIFEKQAEVLERVAEVLGAPPDRLVERATRLMAENKEQRKALEAQQQKSGADMIDEIMKSATSINGHKVIIRALPGSGMKQLRNAADIFRRKVDSGVMVLGGSAGGKASLVAAVTKDLTKRIKAGDIVAGIAPIVGGGGGGRPDMAQAGGKDPSRMSEALEKAEELVKEALQGAA